MSLQNALNFITKVDSDTDFRKSCYTCKTLPALIEMVTNLKMGFTVDEIEDAFNVLLLKCRTYEQAGRVNEVKAWFYCFTR